MKRFGDWVMSESGIMAVTKKVLLSFLLSSAHVYNLDCCLVHGIFHSDLECFYMREPTH